MELTHDDCLRALRAKDARFDGWFVTAVVTTGIYCRPSCPATPHAANVRFLASTAAAQEEGFRACKRCRPDAVPGSPAWDARADLVARAVRLIGDGIVDRGGVDALAAALGYSRRQVERALRAELGAGPLALARSERAHTARLLLETTDLPVAHVALAAGFGSVRQANDTVRAVYACTPTTLRAHRRTGRTPDGVVELRLAARTPLDLRSALGHLAATAVPGVEELRDGTYRRTLRLPHGDGIVALAPREDHVACRLRLADLRDVPVAVARCRRLLDLDADPVAADAALAADQLLAPLVVPGRRVPRTVDEAELALRVVLGQQVSTAAARTHAARLTRALGEPVEDPEGGLTHLFPTPAAIAAVDPETLALPRARRATLLGLAAALASGELDLGPGADRAIARAALRVLPGIGPWSEEVIAMRALGDPDAFCATDLGIRAAAAALGLDARALPDHARRWSPWRAAAAQHLWAATDHEMNRMGLAA